MSHVVDEVIPDLRQSLLPEDDYERSGGKDYKQQDYKHRGDCHEGYLAELVFFFLREVDCEDIVPRYRIVGEELPQVLVCIVAFTVLGCPVDNLTVGPAHSTFITEMDPHGIEGVSDIAVYLLSREAVTQRGGLMQNPAHDILDGDDLACHA